MDSLVSDLGLGETPPVVIVGAGLAGLTCGRALQHRGLATVILEKSRGLGGRIATRRHDGHGFNHGVAAWVGSGVYSQGLLQEAIAHQVLKLWSVTSARWQNGSIQPIAQGAELYRSEAGMTAIAKYLAQGLPIHREWQLQRVEAREETGQWKLIGSQGQILYAQALVMAIPAPQAIAILQTSAIANLPSDLIPTLHQISYDPCLVVMAVYESDGQANLGFDWQRLEFDHHPALSQVLCDRHEQDDSPDCFYILRSTPDFARQFDTITDLTEAGERLLQSAGEAIHPVLGSPQWSQVHRWRYGFPRTGLVVDNWATGIPLPLVFCGDGFGEHPDRLPLDRAIASGTTAAERIASLLIS